MLWLNWTVQFSRNMFKLDSYPSVRNSLNPFFYVI